MEPTSFFTEAERHIVHQRGDAMAAESFTFYPDELRAAEREILLAVNERLYRRQLISEDVFNRAKAAILSS